MISLGRAGALLQATENTLFYATPTDGVADGHLYFNDFWLENPKSLPVKIDEISTEEVRHTLPLSVPIHLSWQEADYAAFQKDFEAIQTKIQQNNWLKAVPMVFERSKHVDHLLTHCLTHLLQAKTGYIYAYWDDKNWFLGLSPEILYSWNGTDVESVAVAGTAFKDKDINLLQNQKEMTEHKYVIDGITEVLKTFGAVEVAETKVFQVGPLTHLKTAIRLPKINLKPDASLIEALHPTPAVGTYPLKYRREDFREAMQPRPPLVFAAPFGLLTPKWHKVIVAIRNLQCLNGDLYLTAGCGVVRDSVLEQEWMELKAKRQAIKQRLGLL